MFQKLIRKEWRATFNNVSILSLFSRIFAMLVLGSAQLAYGQIIGDVNYVSITPPVAGGTVPAGGTFAASISATVKATDTADTVTQIELREGANVLASSTYTISWLVLGDIPKNIARAFNKTVNLGVGVHQVYLRSYTYIGGEDDSPTYTVTVTGAVSAQTINFPLPAGKTYGAGSAALSATASSGLSVSFTSNNPAICGVSGSSATLLAAGSCSITASQSGNASYSAAAPVTQTFGISKAGQSITFTALPSKTLGAAPFAVSATADSGLAVGFTSTTPSICTVSGSTVTMVAAGSCSIAANQPGNTNYNAASQVTQTFSVSPVALTSQTISFAALSAKTYGAAPFSVAATASSGLAVTFTSTTSSICTVSGSTVTLVATGTCSISANQAGNATYSAAPAVTQAFSISKAAQSITFAALSSKSLGTVPFTVSATASSGLAVGFTSTTPSICTVSASTVTLVSTGSCVIAVDQTGNANYNAAPQVTQSFSIVPPPPTAQTISFAALTGKIFGTAPFSLTATATSNLAITYTSTTSSICTVSGSTVTLVAAGTCSITANQAGNGTYSAAPAVTQTFSISKAAQSITFAALPSKTLGAVPFAVSATASSGLVVSFTSTTPSICTVSGSAVTLVATGSCTIATNQIGSANYNAASQVTQSFDVFAADVNYVSITPPLSGGAVASGATFNTGISATVEAAAYNDDTVTMIEMREGPNVLASTSYAVSIWLDSGLPKNLQRAFGKTFNFGIGVHQIYLRSYTYNGGETDSPIYTVTVTEQLPVNNAQFVSQSVPAIMVPGQVYTVTVTMLNSGTTTWSAAGTYKLGSQNPQDNRNWNTTARADLSGPVAPGQQGTFTFSVTAPATTGFYNFQWRMVQENLDWFGELSSNVAVEVVPPPTIAIQRTPATLIAGQAYTVTWSTTNASSLSYSCTANGTGFAGAASVAVNGSNIGTGDAAWVGYPSTCVWTATGAGGSKTFPETLTTIAPPNNAQFVSQNVPDRMVPGQTYPVTVTMLNSGSTTWSSAGTYKLGSQNPQDNRNWNTTARADLSGTVEPGQQGTFSFSVTAPATIGTYNFQWQMVQESLAWFGATSSNVAVAVAPALSIIPPTATLAASPTNVRVGNGASANISFSGNSTDSDGQVRKLELFQDSGSGYGSTPIQTATGAATTLPFSYTYSAVAGLYRFKLRSTDDGGNFTDSTPVIVNVTGSSLLGTVTGVRIDATSTPQLTGWVCQDTVSQGLNYQVYANAPSSLGGMLIGSGVANLATEAANASVQTQCHTPGSGHHFNFDLSTYISQYPNAPLYVQAVAASGGATVVLPCADNNCIMPGSLRIGLTTPLNNDLYTDPATVFMRLQLSGGSGTYDELAFSINGEWINAIPDAATGAYYASKAGLLPSATPYTVFAKVRQGNSTLYSVENQITILAASGTTLTLNNPAAGATLPTNTPFTLTATPGGITSAVQSVKFYNKGTLIGTGSNNGGVWKVDWTPAMPGTYLIMARAFNGSGLPLAQTSVASITVVASQNASSSTPIAVTIEPPHLGNADAGTLPGSLGVGNSGAATYSVALVVPPGTAGMQPNLSLDYSSQGANGMLGLGWSLGGLSSIHRCGKTIAQDDVNDRISFSNTDRLCLNGQRLVLVNLPVSDANYWASNAEYRTEIESFSRIKRLPNGGFQVESKDGRVTTYGTSESSYVKPIVGFVNSGATAEQPKIENKVGAQSWAVDTITDRVGNYVSYSYEQDLATGEHRPTFIRYGGLGLPAHAAVQFVHEARNDAWKRYIDETRNDLRSRISHIKTYVGSNLNGDVLCSGTVVRDYSLQYEYSPTSGRSLLNSMQACARNPQTSLMECLPKTSFAWGKPVPGKQAGFESKGIWAGAPVLTTHMGTGIVQAPTNAAIHPDYFAFSDFENHGRTDVLEKRVADPGYSTDRHYDNPITPGTLQTQYRYFHNNGTGFTPYNYKLDTGEYFAVLDIGDFDGDGTLDLLVSTGGAAKICLSPLGRANALGAPGSTIVFTCDPTRPAVGENVGSHLPYVVDILGDGRSAHYSQRAEDGSAMACIQGSCVRDATPPAYVLGVIPNSDGLVNRRSFVDLDQAVDFTGIGKHYDARWTAPSYIVPSAEGGTAVGHWINLTPTILTTDFHAPGDIVGAGKVAQYAYASDSSSLSNFGTPYIFDSTIQGGSVSGDFNGSGYANLAFGFYTWGQVTTPQFKRADMNICLATGRALDCAIRKKYSGAQYRAPRSVSDFVGDGQAKILVETNPILTGDGSILGSLQMCRVMGDDTTGGTASNDSNIVCDPWPGLTIPHVASFAVENPLTAIYQMDLLGTGRPQLVFYHGGHIVDGMWDGWIEDGRWEVFAPIDLAAPNQALDRIYQVTNGVGATSTVEYVDGLPGGIVSQSGTSTLAYPQHTTMNAGKLVSRLRTANGNYPERTVSYQYQDAAIDLAGRGALGFAQVTATDEQTGIVSTTNFSQDWPTTGMVRTAKSASRTGSVLSSVQNTLDVISLNAGKTVFPYVKESLALNRDLDFSDLGTSYTVNAYTDGWGNLNQQTVTLSGAGKTFTSQTTSVFKNDSTSWQIGLPTSVSTTKTDPVSGSLTRTVAFDYDAKGLLATETIEPLNSALKVVTTYGRASNPFGLVNKKTQAWFDPSRNEPRTRTVSDTTYDVNGRYPALVKNALGQQESHDYDPGTGVRRSLVGPNNLPTTWEANGFGRVTKEKRADGNETRSYVKACNGACPFGASVAQITDSFHGSERISVPHLVYSDSAGHVLRNQSWGFDGSAIVSDQRYDDLGRLWETDHPRYLTDTPYLANRQEYDELNRVVKVTTVDEAGVEHASTTQYQGMLTTLTNANNQVRVDTRNVAKQLEQVKDAKLGLTKFEYEPFGNLGKTIDPNGNVILVSYDLLGRKTKLQDPDLGIIDYYVDPIGQTWKQVSPKQRLAGQSTTFNYDDLGRMTARIEPDLKSYWIFDSATKGIGQLGEAYTLNGTIKDYRRLHSYDSLGRPSLTTQTLTDGSYTSATEYDAWGRNITQTYQRNSDLAKAYGSRYNNTGYLARIERGGLVLWQVAAQDAANRPSMTVLGNGLSQTRSYNEHSGRLDNALLKTGTNALRLQEGYHYDAIGSVKNRTQYWDLNGFQEDFTYDALNRLATSTIQGQAGQSFSYDAAGNLRNKSNVSAGDYVYPSQGATAIRPHAVQSIPGIAGSFTYDDNGNLTGGAGRNISWNSFDMPVQIAKGGITSNFVYGPEHQRTRQDRSDGSSIIYVGAQEVETKGTVTTVKTYWPGGIGLEIDKGAAPTELRWTHLDRLGSPVAISDETGILKERLAYDAWGKRRNLNDSGVPDTLDGVVDNKGYTGHEMLDQLDLVHMNGRVYDPLTAKFLSGDPLIQDPTNGQNYNRYSYVLNNPTNLIDPTGFADCVASAKEGMCQTTGTATPAQTKPTEPIQTVTVTPVKSATSQATGSNGTVLSIGGGETKVNAKNNSRDLARASGAIGRYHGNGLSTGGQSTLLDGLPGVGTLKSAGQLYTGKDLVTGEDVNRWVEGGGIALGIIPGGKLLANFGKIGISKVGQAWKGAGPIAGTIGVSPATESIKALQNFSPGNGVEYVFDTITSTFVVGNGTMKHSPLAASIGADTNLVVGGIFSRGTNGSILTNEGSGHFWQNWTPEIRQQYVDFMKSMGVNVIHSEGK